MSVATLSGRLGFADVGGWLGKIDALASLDTVDLSQVQQVDSAGLALLLEMTRRAQRRGVELKIIGASAQVREMVAFFGLGKMLRLDH